MSGIGWAIRDTWVIACRDLAHWRQQPVAVIANTLLFPVMIVVMFGYLLGGAMTVPGGGDYRDFLMPGMFAMTMVFGIGATVAAVGADAARGVTDRFRSLPMASSAVIGGRAAADMLNSAAALAVLTGCGLATGWHPHLGAARAAAALGLLLLLRFAFVWVGVYLGLRFAANPEALTTVRTIEFPLGFLGNPFVAVAAMPAWLGAVAVWNPLSSTVTAARQLFGDPVGAPASWITGHAVVMAVAWPLLLIAVFFPLSVRRYDRLRTASKRIPGDDMRQGDLFEALEPAVDDSFAAAERTELDSASWIEHVPGWLHGGDGLFGELMATAPWEQRYRYIRTLGRVIEPRLTAEYADISDAPQGMLHTITAALARHYEVDYRYLWMNLYRTNRDSTSWHGDPIGKYQPTSIVPVLSLGATRRFLIKPVEGGPSVSLAVASGDLVVMGGRSQIDWRHCVPKQAAATGPRISINFAPHYSREEHR